MPLHDLAARERLGDALFRYMQGQPADALPEDPDANQLALRRFRLLPRVLQGNEGINTETTLLQQPWAAPLGVGAFAGDRIFHEEGVLPIARACKRLQLPLVISEETVTPLEQIGAEYDRCWLQLRAAGDVGRIKGLIDQAAQAGFKNIVLTVLAPVHPVAGLQPGGFSIGDALKQRGWHTIGGTQPGVEALPAFPVWRWQHIDEIAAHCAAIQLPLWLKGILHHDDATQAAQHGVSGLIVSNIGLRQSARWATPVDQLADLQAVTRLPLLLDGGLRCGSDAVVARCLGASLSLSVRPVISALVAGGENAVFDLLFSWINEITAISHWCGVSDMASLNGNYVSEVRT
ncbi:alpha-hydroxy-acid oxidizing protein [Pantoea dispersa]|uniref:alpha-hydroxy acid oxidase n=1 Tax=Pantoea dispersa TaxID=59814 RepID=UPI0007376CDA|nr:alpha-hydroxy acid oxidase [Pantoea dispersa]KTS00288.1 alpha-hydroxy acid dehydrogenase [Pantoea dispersa]MEB5834913.1 alpha-hydroxy-acid oxidizing protein [Pantoea dispersa]QZY89444.1 alpha-hydroxy-acid oxidizing protein [Pantoea dispersa]